MNGKQVKKLAIVVVFGVLAIFIFSKVFVKDYSYQGSLIDPPLEAFDFSLMRSDGKKFQLSDHRENVVLMFFGYTNCPDVCPTTLGDFKRIIISLEEKAKNVTVVYITVDPNRDTPDVMEQYATAFHPDFIGLSGSMEELQPIWDAFYVFRAEIESESESGYLMEYLAYV